MYTYYFDFLKSFKKFLTSTFPDIKHYQFNYADKAFLNYKLYQQHVQEFPMCMINLTDISVEDNRDFFRYIGAQFSQTTIQPIATNHTKKDSILMDFKWVTLTVDIKINLKSKADLLEYHNLAISNFPKNMMFYSYKYYALIKVNDYINGWEVTDDTEGLQYRSVNSDIEGFAQYEIEPIFKVNGITKNGTIDQGTSLDVQVEIRLKVPNVIGNKTLDDRIVKGIQILGNVITGSNEIPILIDMNNDIYSDRTSKCKREYIIQKDDIILKTDVTTDANGVDITNEYHVVHIAVDNFLNQYDMPINLIFVEDSTESSPRIEYQEIEVLTNEYIVNYTEQFNGVDVEIEYYDIKLDFDYSTFHFNELTSAKLLVFA